MISEFADLTSELPQGRYATTLEFFETTYVLSQPFSGSTTRGKIWADFKVALNLLRSVVPIASVWVGGSFTTSKVNPSDIDCLFVIDSDDLLEAHKDSDNAQIVAWFAVPGLLKLNNLLVDSYVLPWRAVTEPHLLEDDDLEYYRARGYWDDWWQRQRVVPDQLDRRNTFPQRGYLEVIVDGLK